MTKDPRCADDLERVLQGAIKNRYGWVQAAEELIERRRART